MVQEEVNDVKLSTPEALIACLCRPSVRFLLAFVIRVAYFESGWMISASELRQTKVELLIDLFINGGRVDAGSDWFLVN